MCILPDIPRSWHTTIQILEIMFQIHPEQRYSKESMVQIWKVLHQLEKIGFLRWHTHVNVLGKVARSPVTKLFRPCCYKLYYINTNLIDPADITPIAYTDYNDKI